MLNCPGESVALGVRACGMGVGQWLWEKLLDWGQKGPSSNRLTCHMSGLLHLCSLWQKTSFLFLHIFQGLPSPEELLMQMIDGKACPSLSHIFCEHSSLHCCVSSLGIRLRGASPPFRPQECVSVKCLWCRGGNLYKKKYMLMVPSIIV